MRILKLCYLGLCSLVLAIGLLSCTEEPAIVAVTSVTLDSTSITLIEGDSQALNDTVFPSNAENQKVLWSSSNSSVASVKEGVVTALEVGNATILAKTDDGRKTASCTVIVEAKNIPVTGVILDKTSYEMTEGEEFTLTATINPENATNKNVSWSSNNTNIATVSNGTVIALAPGQTSITAITEDGGKIATCEVIVNKRIYHVENIYRHYVSKTPDTIFIYTKGYAIGEDLCCRMMNRNINGIWDFFDWQRIPNTTDIVASTFDGHILINGGTGTDYISAYTVAAVNNADGDSQVINPTGGWHGYNSKTANVTATARTIMLKVFADGKEVGENESAYCNDVKIMFVNNVQGWNTQKADGTGREILQQKCTIIFNKFDINIEIETTALEDVKLIKHYGLNAQNNMNSSDVVVHFVGDTTTIPQGRNGQSSDKEARMLMFFGDNDNFAIEIADFGEGTYKYNALDYSGIYVGGTRKGYFACIYRNPECEQDWVELTQGATLFLRGAYKCSSLSR